jgi:hypothetical protein
MWSKEKRYKVHLLKIPRFEIFTICEIWYSHGGDYEVHYILGSDS